MINGSEAGGGTIRIHDPEVQQQVFGLLGIDAPSRPASGSASCSTRLQFGAPPHGGIALGIDRWVMLFGGLTTSAIASPFPRRRRPPT